MKKLILLIVALFAMSCLTHKDIAQAKADMYEQIVEHHEQQRTELYIKDRVNDFLLLLQFQRGYPYANLTDVRIVESQSIDRSMTRYLCDVGMQTSFAPFMVNRMTVDVLNNLSGIRQLSFELNPFVAPEGGVKAKE